MPFPLHQRLLSPGHRYERVPVRKGCQRQETVETQASLWTGEVLTDQGSEGQVILIGAFHDDILLPIFDFHLREEHLRPGQPTRAWQSLVHVCRRWRSVVFGSPRRLDLRLFCTNYTRSRDMLDIWPALPLTINGDGYYSTRSVDNIVAALKCSVRVCQIDLVISKIMDLERFLAAMQQPFPELTYLNFRSTDETETVVVPDSFLNGFAPRLERLQLYGIPFPGLPKLLLSATRLVHLHLYAIPHSGYFSPDAMVAALSTLTSLENLTLEFKSPESCPDLEPRRLPPPTRTVLPVLTVFRFQGVTEYLEDFVTDIDAPQLNKLETQLFNDIVFDTPQLIQLISRTPVSSALENAHIALDHDTAHVTFQSRISGYTLKLSILCEGLDWQLSSLKQVCTSCLPFLSTLKDLYIHEHARSQPDWKDDIENSVWLDLLHPFTAVENLYISEKVALHIGAALQELVEGRTTEVLPTLGNIFLEGLSSGPVQEGIRQFVAARQVSSHPVTISRWANSGEDKNDL